MIGFIALFFNLFLSIFFISSTYAFDKTQLIILLVNEIKKSSINREVQISQIKFIGFEPQGNCISENLKIREIKRPSSVEFTFNCGTRQYRAIANYDILTTIYVTQRPMKRGDTVEEKDLLEIKQPISRVPAGAITDKNLIIGKVVKRSLAQGLIIKDDHLYEGFPVKRGSKVNLIIDTEFVIIMTEGVLKYDSVVGNNARILCIQTGKEIVGKLIDKDTVRVSI